MMKNIVLGALAGAAIAYLIVEKKNHKSMEHAYHQLGDYLHKVRLQMMHKFEKGKGHAECMGEKAGKMMHGYMK